MKRTSNERRPQNIEIEISQQPQKGTPGKSLPTLKAPCKKAPYIYGSLQKGPLYQKGTPCRPQYPLQLLVDAFPLKSFGSICLFNTVFHSGKQLP